VVLDPVDERFEFDPLLQGGFRAEQFAGGRPGLGEEPLGIGHRRGTVYLASMR
jgi:hypothetical protein